MKTDAFRCIKSNIWQIDDCQSNDNRTPYETLYTAYIGFYSTQGLKFIKTKIRYIDL